MTDRKKALEALLEKVDAGEWDFSANAPVRQVFPYRSASADDLGLTSRAAFNGSLDAARSLHEAVLPYGYESFDTFSLSGEVVLKCERPINLFYGFADGNPARAWLIAILRALIEQEGGE